MVEKARVIERTKEYEMERYKKNGQTFGKRTYDNFMVNSVIKKIKFFKTNGVSEEGVDGKHDVTCWKCKGSHYPRKCSQLQHRCYYCGEKGHTTITCPKSKIATCIVCNQVGHISTNCPQRVNTIVSPSYSKRANGMTGPKNRTGSKVATTAKVYAMYGTPIENVEMEEVDEGNIWIKANPYECGLITGM